MANEITCEVTHESLREFERSLLDLGALLNKSVGDVLRQQARLVCVNLAWNTQPYGLGLDARKLGEWAAMRDVGKVYRSVDVVYAEIAKQSEDAAKGFYAAALNGRLDVAKHILRGCGLSELLGADIGAFDPAIHHGLRNNRGRVSIRTPRLIVTDPKVLLAYHKLVVSRVGTAKSSWATCAQQLGGVRGIPFWATKNRAPGHVQDLSQQANDPRVILSSRVDYMPTACPENMQRDALDKQRGKMQTAIKIAMTKGTRLSRLAA